MKTTILFLAVGLFATSAMAQNFTASQTPKRQVQPRRAALVAPANGKGSVQWAAKLDNPAQAVNPLAPKEYGDGSQFIDLEYIYDPSQRTAPGRPRGQGVKLFSFSF